MTDRFEEYRRRMEDVSLLPPEHPERQAVVKEIVSSAPQLEQEWLSLLQENERLRLELARVDEPAGLHDRLLAIPKQYPQPSRWRLVTPRWIGPIAALILVSIAVAVLTVRQNRAAAYREFASLVLLSHEARPQLAIESSDWMAVSSTLKATPLKFPIERPTLDQDPQLVGGRIVTLDGHSVVYTRWRHNGRIYSLYQFCASDFNLPHPLPRQTIARREVQGTGNREVTLWSEDHCDYALVIDEEPASESGPA